jgi:hypothetical protein
MKNQETIYTKIYSLLKQYDREPTDVLITIQLIARNITITPLKGLNSNLRGQLITLCVTNGYSPNIKPNS